MGIFLKDFTNEFIIGFLELEVPGINWLIRFEYRGEPLCGFGRINH